MAHGFPSRQQVEEMRRRYVRGLRVRLISMDDPYAKLKPGDKGTVIGVDDAGQILTQWDCGSSLSLIPGVDRFECINPSGS